MFPPFVDMPFTYSICVLVMLTSILGFYNKRFHQALIYHPYEVFRGKRIHTILTSALIHKKWWHLIFNVYIFYGVNRDIEYIILEEDFSKLAIEVICFLIVCIGVILPNLIRGYRNKNKFDYTSEGFSGATFCSLGFSGLYLPLDYSPKTYKLFPFLHYAYEFAFFGLLIFALIAIVFRHSKKNNHLLHVHAYLIGFLLAILCRPRLIVELSQHLITFIS